MKDDLKKHDIIVRAFLDDDLDKLGIVKTSDLNLVAEEIKNADVDIITKMMWHDIKTELADDILVKVDRATMSVGLEGREPFLDNKIVEYTAQMPLRFKYRKGKSKFILRKILYKYVPPKLIERPKMGFSIPLYEWFRNELSQMYKEYLDPGKIKRDGIFNVNMVSDLLNKYFSGKGISKEKLWYIFVFQLWKEKWL
jgi:asparagine synthase (glutamine-hydrolysing)